MVCTAPILAAASIDIIGFDINPGADHYFKLMQTVTQKTAQCLK